MDDSRRPQDEDGRRREATERDGPKADQAREQEVERTLATLEGRFLALAGAPRPDDRRLVNNYYDLTRELGDLERRRHFRELAEFAPHYGARDFWKAAFIRLGCDIKPGGWTLGEWYREGDEWRFVFGKDCQDYVKAAKDIAATADAATPDAESQP